MVTYVLISSNVLKQLLKRHCWQFYQHGFTTDELIVPLFPVKLEHPRAGQEGVPKPPGPLRRSPVPSLQGGATYPRTVVSQVQQARCHLKPIYST